MNRIILSLSVTVASIGAQSSPEMVDAALRQRFGFVGPVIHKIGDGIDLLRAVDLNGDGAVEIVVDHSARGRLTILERQDHDSIRTRYVDTDGTIYGLAIADISGDAVPDFVTLERQGRVAVRLGPSGAELQRRIEVGPVSKGDALRLGDVDGDGTPDAVVLLEDGVRVVTHLGRDDARVSPTIPLDVEGVWSFLLQDVDGDAALDVAVATNRPGMPLHVMFGDGAGGFGSWVLFPTPTMRRAFSGLGTEAGRPSLMVVQDRRARVVDYAIERVSAADSGGVVAPQLTSLRPLQRGAFPHVQADFDGDGDLDLVLAHPERAELIYMLEDGGKFDVQRVPSLAGIASLAVGDHDGDGRVDILIASPEEDAVAWRRGGSPLDEFPARLPSTGKPVAVAVEADGSVLFLTKDKKRIGALHRVRFGADAAVEIGAVGRLSGDPSRLVLAELDGVDGDELVFVVPSDGLRVVRFAGEERRAQIEEGTASAGFTKKIEDGALSVVQHEGRPALMVVRDRFARTFRLDAAGELVVVRQLNAPSSAKKLALGAGCGAAQSVFVDREVDKLFVVESGRAARAYTLPQIGAHHALDHAGDMLLLGRSGVVRMPFATTWALRSLRTQEPPTEDTNFWLGCAADFDSDGVLDAAVLDEDINGVHVLVKTAEGLGRALSFPVFELPEKGDTVFEPREVAGADWDGDGRADLILISHDRILIYKQEP